MNTRINVQLKKQQGQLTWAQIGGKALLVLLVVLVQSACSTSGSVAWSKIQDEGLIPYLVEHSADEMPEVVMADRLLESLDIEFEFEVTQPTERIASADLPAPLQGTVVSGVSMRNLASHASEKEPLRDLVSAAKEDSSETAAAEVIQPEQSPIPSKIRLDSLDREPILDELMSLPAQMKAEFGVPVGERVPEKPSYVYSPFGASNQLVDVEGHEPGSKVKCPYSGKVFEVPAIESEAGAGE